MNRALNRSPFRPATAARRVWLALPAGLLLVACASLPPPKAEMAVAEAAVLAANNASTVENAPAELQAAQAKLLSARAALAREDHAAARRLAEQAQLDAQVAVLHAQAVRTRKAAQESQDAARALNEEINRKSVR